MFASRHAAAVRDENKAERAERRSTWWNGLVGLLAQALFNAHKTRNTQQASNTLNEDRAHTDCRRDSAERNAGMLAHLMDWDQFIRTQAPHISHARNLTQASQALTQHICAQVATAKRIDSRRQGCGGVCSTCEAASASASASAFAAATAAIKNMFQGHGRALPRRCEQRQLLTVHARAAARATEGELGSGLLAAVLG
jgi:hypothetical protein